MSKTALIAILAVVVVLGGAAWAFFRFAGPPPGSIPLTPEAKAYVHNLKLGPVEMKATDSYVHQTITEILGSIANAGDRSIRSVDIYCIFYDAYGQVVLRERSPIVKPSAGAFKPGDTRNYRLPFDNIPASWNHQLPQLVIAHIDFE